ncbi:MAG TPA: hypothetical protein VMT66_00420 [Steroidobacteraceae bacterium]|nr:hypothetical protein [Steroidobacteraceae bacterium]
MTVVFSGGAATAGSVVEAIATRTGGGAALALDRAAITRFLGDRRATARATVRGRVAAMR